MTSWKLMAAAIKAQRTWANLSPAQKAEVRKAAQKAAVNAYARMNEARQPARAQPSQAAPPQAQPSQAPPPQAQPSQAPPPQAQPSQAAPPEAQPSNQPPSSGPSPGAAPHAGAGETQGVEQPAPPPHEAQTSSPDAEPGFVELTRAHGPRIARQAAATAATRSRNAAGQLAGLWRKAQRP